MKIVHILPELQIGGVERHVIDLANQQVRTGHEVAVVSAGGQMESQLDGRVQKFHLPVQKKNPITGYVCARSIARFVRENQYDLIHAHSRVPAWIAMWASSISGRPYVVTAHVDFGTKTRWIYTPYRHAHRVICVSEAVRSGMKDCFYANTTVILNGLKRPKLRWDSSSAGAGKLLFVGRLSSVKGLQDVLRVLKREGKWTLDVVGDGPQRSEWETLCRERGISDRVTFHGYSEEVERFMAASSCLLFPSYTEGMPLTLAQAVLVGIPVLASDITPVAELKGDREGLIPPGDENAWSNALNDYLTTGNASVFSADRVPTLERMTDEVIGVYRSVLAHREI